MGLSKFLAKAISLLLGVGCVKLVESSVEFLCVLEVSGLLTLHRIDCDLVEKCELIGVGFFIRFSDFDALS